MIFKLVISGRITEVKHISGDPLYIEQQLQILLTDGWEIIDVATNVYQSSGGLRTETTAYLKKATA